MLVIILNPAIAATPSAEEIIRSLYRAHQPWNGKKVDLANGEHLKQFFDAELTGLFLKDDDCKARTQEICNLNYDPILCAQDYDDKGIGNLTVKELGNLRYEVTFNNLGTNKLTYTMHRTKDGWRIRDIQCPEGHSVKKHLSS